MADSEFEDSSDPFLDLAARHLAGELDAEGQAALFALLAESEVRQQAMLEMAWQARVMSAGLVPAIGTSWNETSQQAKGRPAGGSGEKSPVLGFLGEAFHRLGQLGTSSKVIAVVVAGGLLCYFGGLLAVVAVQQIRNLRAPVQSPVAGSQPAASESKIPALRPQFARLTCGPNCKWSRSELLAAADSDQGVELGPGQSLHLIAGTAEITFASGVRLAFVGPMHAALKSSTLFDLQVGRLMARVPHDAIGFTVSTPGADVVDLGTEFGVDVQPDGRTEVHVAEGSVAVNRARGGLAGSASLVILLAGQAAKISANHTIETAKFRGADFAILGNAVHHNPNAAPPGPTRQLTLHSGMSERVLDRLVGPNRYELVSQGKPVSAKDEGGGEGYFNGPDGKEVFPPESLVDGRLNENWQDGTWSYWLSDERPRRPEVTIDLESVYSIVALALQNTRNRYNDSGTRGLRISLSTDGERFESIGEFELPKPPDSGWIDMQTFILPKPADARLVKIEVLSWYGLRPGLNEVQVFAAPSGGPEKPAAGNQPKN